MIYHPGLEITQIITNTCLMTNILLRKHHWKVTCIHRSTCYWIAITFKFTFSGKCQMIMWQYFISKIIISHERNVIDFNLHTGLIFIIHVGHYKELSTQRPGSPKNTTQQHDVSVQSTLDRRPMYYSQKMDPSSPNANSIMWTHTSLEIKFKIK